MLNVTNSILLATALLNSGLTVFILRGNWKNSMNLFFGLFLLALSAWAFVLIGFQTSTVSDIAIYYGNAAYAAGLLVGASFYLFSISFPENTKPKTLAISAVYGLSLLYIAALFVDPMFLIKEATVYPWGKTVQEGLLEYLIFVLLFGTFYFGGLIRIWFKYLQSHGIVRKQLFAIGLSMSITGAGGIYYNIVLAYPFLHNYLYLWSGPIFTTPIAIIIMYSIFRFHLFNVRVITTELLVSILWISTFLRTLLASDPREQVLNGGLFILSVIIGYLLVRSASREIYQKEQLALLNDQLGENNLKLNDKTVELNQQLAEIERMNKYMVDRELKMVELKKKLEETESKLSGK